MRRSNPFFLLPWIASLALAMTAHSAVSALSFLAQRVTSSSVFIPLPSSVGSRRAKLALGSHIESEANDLTGGGCSVNQPHLTYSVLRDCPRAGALAKAGSKGEKPKGTRTRQRRTS